MHTSALGRALSGAKTAAIRQIVHNADGSIKVYYTNGGKDTYTADQVREFLQHLADNIDKPTAPRKPRPPIKDILKKK